MEWTWVNCLLKGRTVETADIRHLRCESMFHVCAWSFWSCFDIHALFGTWNTSHGLHSFSLEPKDQERAVTEPASGKKPLLSLLHHCYIIVTSLLHHCYIIVTSLLHCLSDHPSTELGILMPRMPRLGVYMGIPSTKDVRHWAPSACERMPSSPVIKLLVVFCLESAYGIVVLMGFRLGPTEIERPLEPG